jgi:hypothetical protein
MIMRYANILYGIRKERSMLSFDVYDVDGSDGV